NVFEWPRVSAAQGRVVAPSGHVSTAARRRCAPTWVAPARRVLPMQSERPLHPATELVVARLREAGASGEVRVLPAAAPTAVAAAEQLGCEVGAIANSLIFAADGAPLLVLTSGAHRVDTTKVASLVGVAKLRRADPEFVRAATGQPIGGVAPIGHP